MVFYQEFNQQNSDECDTLSRVAAAVWAIPRAFPGCGGRERGQKDRIDMEAYDLQSGIKRANVELTMRRDWKSWYWPWPAECWVLTRKDDRWACDNSFLMTLNALGTAFILLSGREIMAAKVELRIIQQAERCGPAQKALPNHIVSFDKKGIFHVSENELEKLIDELKRLERRPT